MTATIRLVILTAVRDRLFAGLIALLILSGTLSIFLGSTAITEQLETATVFAAGAGRFVLVLGLTIFAALHIQTLFETREVEAILSRAISRTQFVIAYWLGLACVAGAMAGFFGLLLWGASGFQPGFLLWAATLVAECVVVVAVAMFAGLMMERATPTVLFTMGFYALARLMGFFVGIRETATDFSPATTVVKHSLDLVLLFIPRLDMFAQTQWLVHGVERIDGAFLSAQAVLFVILVIAAASYDLTRKQF